ncbi:hypothetical protein R6Z07F_019185 [Ovis aries]
MHITCCIFLIWASPVKLNENRYLIHLWIFGCHQIIQDKLKKLKYLVIHPNGEGNGTPLQYSCLENPMDGGAWWAAVHVVAKSRTRLSDFTFTFHFHALEEEMATHSSVLAWRIPGTGEPGGLPSMVSHSRTRLKRLSSSSSSSNTHKWFKIQKLRSLPPISVPQAFSNSIRAHCY